MTDTDVTFGSDNANVAEVNASGLITIKGAGTAVIAVESKGKDVDGNKVKKTVDLTVNAATSVVESLPLTSTNSYSMVRGLDDTTQGITNDAAQIALTVKYTGKTERMATSADVTFSSNKASVATVGENGALTFSGLGTAVITVKSKAEKEGGGIMEHIINVEVKKPTTKTDLIVSKYESKDWGDGVEHKITVKNVSGVIFGIAGSGNNPRFVLVYYLDASGKVFGKFTYKFSGPTGIWWLTFIAGWGGLKSCGQFWYVPCGDDRNNGNRL